MTTPTRAAQMLQNLKQWAPLLTPTTTIKARHYTLTTPQNPPTHDLADLLTPTIDADQHGAATIRTHAQITRWATQWAQTANLTYTDHPLDALTRHTQHLSQHWNDWDAFTDDLTLLHTRIAHITGHTPRPIGPCPTPGCPETTTQAQTSHGLEGPIECPRGHTYTTHTTYTQALHNNKQHTLQNIQDPTIYITIPELLNIWPHLTRDTIKNWTRHNKLPTTNTHPRRINLAKANQLARNHTPHHHHPKTR